jgi:N-acetylglucosamine kinase-like BadF-type ATPase
VALYLGVDGGGTKTAAAAVDASGRPRGSASAGPSTFKSLGLAAAAAVLADVVAAAAGGERLAALVAGVADVDTSADQAAVRAALEVALGSRSVSVGRLEVVNDSVIALASGTAGLTRGIACIAGTGSVAFGASALDREARAGGWGPPFADAGSAYWIGFQAVGRALKLHDAGRVGAPLVRELLGAAGCATLPELVYEHLGEGGEGGIARARLAALARAVETAALAGDADAQAIFAAAGAELAELVVTLARRLAFGAQPFDVVLVGGVWSTRASALHDRFRADLAAGAPSARVVRPSVEPALGAALLARTLDASGRRCPAGLISPPDA